MALLAITIFCYKLHIENEHSCKFIDSKQRALALRDNSLGWDKMTITGKHKNLSKGESMDELRSEVEELRELVHTLLTIIMQEADGIQTGAAPMIPNHPKRRFSM